ncbi:MAG: adaptor protein MecA [Eubacteriales bacterium]
MKIEKINDNQIRCTLTRADLAIRELKLSELAYGTEKAKSLFRDMMKQAAAEFDFDAEDIPLMIEAIPSSSGSIVLIITKVEDPEELDTRFSKFAPTEDALQKADALLEKLEGAEDFLDLINSMKDSIKELDDVPATTPDTTLRVRLFSFATIDSVIYASNLLDNLYTGINTLYKDNLSECYVLALSQAEHTNLEFNRICNMLSEYSTLEKANGITIAYLEEHCEVIISSDAVQQLNTI